MDECSFNKLIEGASKLLIVNELALCRIDDISIEADKFPTSMDNQLIVADIGGSFKTNELDVVAYDSKIDSMIVINKEEEKNDYSIVLYHMEITDSNNNVVHQLQGYTNYTYIAKAIRILNVEGDKWIKIN